MAQEGKSVAPTQDKSGLTRIQKKDLIMRTRTISAVLALALPMSAQAGDWTHSVSVYGWFPALDSTIGTAFGDLDMSVSAKDLISNLDMAFMGAYEANNGQWGFVGDLFYSDISSSKPGPFGFASADLDLELTILSGFATYRISQTDTSIVDLYGGLRAYDMTVDGQFNGGANPTFGGADTWVDPVIGIRGRWSLSEKWGFTALLDLGGFGIGSDMSGQFLGTFDYAINDRWDFRFGYRYLAIDKPIGGRDNRIDLHGPILGASYTF